MRNLAYRFEVSNYAEDANLIEMGHVNRNAATPTTLLSWQEALAIIESCDAKGTPVPFAIAFCTADESKQTGGEIIRYDKAVWYVAGGQVKQSAHFERVGRSAVAGKPSGKRPNHHQNWTRNIRSVNNEQIRKLHLHLILEINGQPVR